MYLTLDDLMTKLVRLFLCSIIWSQSIFAGEYTITGSDGQVGAVISAFSTELEKQHADISMEHLDGVGSASELTQLLDNKLIDIAAVPFEEIPALAGSPLLKPLLAKDAAALRQTINSEIGALAKADLERGGYRVLDFWHVSSTILGSKGTVSSVAEVQGIKVFGTGGQSGDDLEALGASPVQMAFAEVVPALERGAVDAGAIPFDSRAQELGFAGLLENYVDRVYKPAIYAVIVTDDLWKKIPFADQYFLAKVAGELGDSLVESLDVQAESFRSEERERGAVFNVWGNTDIAAVRAASLSTVAADNQIQRELVSLAFDVAASTPAAPDDVEAKPASEVSLLFVTDRELEDFSKPDIAFSSKRELNGHTFGLATVLLKDGRKYGDNIKKTAVIKNLSKNTDAEFWGQLTTAPERDIVLYVHGYNNAFTDSIRRGATIQEDIAPEAIVISYTWPSDGELLSYGYDTSSTDTAQQNFDLFLDNLAERVSADRINVISHSMGTRILAKYLAALPTRGIKPEQVKFKNIVFAAADLSRDFFEQKQTTPPDPKFPLSAYAESTTVYSSQNDRPLGFSLKVHGDRRLGLADQETIFVDEDIVSIDASPIEQPSKWYQKFSFATRHSYVFDKSEGVRDLSLLLLGTKAAVRPGMTMRKRDGIVFWELSR